MAIDTRHVDITDHQAERLGADRDQGFLKYNLQGPLEVFGVDKMDLNGVVLTAQFRTVSGGQYAVSRAFNQRLKKLVDNCAEVQFAQTYPQQVMVPVKAALEHEPPEAGAKTVNP